MDQLLEMASSQLENHDLLPVSPDSNSLSPVSVQSVLFWLLHRRWDSSLMIDEGFVFSVSGRLGDLMLDGSSLVSSLEDVLQFPGFHSGRDIAVRF